MKRTISVLMLILLCITAFFGCTQKKIIPLEYTPEILINLEYPDKELVWAGRFETPSIESGFFLYSESKFFGVVYDHGIEVSPLKNDTTYFKFGDAYANEYIAKILKIKREKLREKFNLAVPRDKCFIWEDVELFHFYVDESNAYEEKPTEYAGKYVFIEYRDEDKKSYIKVLTPEEYGDSRPSDSICSSYTGRIGNVCYFTAGYYDLSTHEYKCYETESELPKYKMEVKSADRGVLNILRQDEILSGYLDDENLYYVNKYYYLNDRIYAAVVTGDNFESNYESSDLLIVMLDANTNKVLYAERFHSTNYYMGSRSSQHSMYVKGEDGLLYDPYISE